MSEDRLELKKKLLKTLLAPVFDNSALSGGTDGGDNVENKVKDLLESAIDAKWMKQRRKTVSAHNLYWEAVFH